MSTGTRLNFSLVAAPYTVNKEDLMDVLFPSVSTADLADATHRINTEDKFIGRQVFESTLGFGYFATGTAATDDWTLNDGLGATQVTPS